MDLTSVILLVVFGLQWAIPISIAADGELVTEKSGVLNIGIYGVMLIGGFTAAVVDYETGAFFGPASPYAGLLAGMAAGAAVNLFLALLSTRLHVDQVIAGIGINIFAVGLTYVLLQRFFIIDGTPIANSVAPLFTIGGLAQGIAPKISPLMAVMFILPVLVYLFLGKTKLGLRIRATGENPKAAEAAGIDVAKTRIAATALGGTLLGLGGAYLTVDFFNSFVPDPTGTLFPGFIALAAVIAGGWNPLYVLGMSILFGGSVGLRFVLIAPGGTVYLTYLLPYIVTVVVLGIASKRLRPPAALALPYKKE
ncbi:MAG: ABC transporter permease [Nitrososphaerota archaeon]|nr:ABC transporter permease [Nitrososphaerota archaeon]